MFTRRILALAGVLTCQSVSDHGEGSSPPTTQQVIATLRRCRRSVP
jgi:hypothetical protein